VLRPLNNLYQSADYPDLLVGMETPDDAAVWKLDEKRALVVTTDFFTPVVDDPYAYGAIAAANSLSDVYAMGGKPFLALNIAALPPNLPADFVSEIIRGGAEKAREAGIAIVGGHTVQDKEPKYGLVALGFVDNGRILTKAAARAGDQLILSKPLGFGVTTTAIKRQMASEEDTRLVIEWMSKLNDRAAELATSWELKAATDITGFSLMGHAWEMADSSGVRLRFEHARIPFLDCAHAYIRQSAFPGGAFDNKLFYGPHVEMNLSLEETQELALFDPQTSGGLLLAVPAAKLDGMLAEAKEKNIPLWHIGEVVEGSGIEVV
jgi:selenide,water dikinase